MYHKLYKYRLIKLLLYQLILDFILCETIYNQTSFQDLNETVHDSTCRNLFLVISLGSLFIYLFSLCMYDYLSKDNLPEVYSSRNKQSLILSKYLVKLIFGKWSSNLDVNYAFLIIEFNAHDSKITSSSFIMPLHWLKKFMDHVGTKDNPHLKSIKFWLHQPDSLGTISSVRMAIRDTKNLNTCIYIDSIELSKVNDDIIQIIKIKKNIKFVNLNQQSLNIELEFRKNSNLKPRLYDGYAPYFVFIDYSYFYIIYLDLSFLILNYVSFDSILDFTLIAQTPFSYKKLIIGCLIRSSICIIFLITISTLYLIFIKSKLSMKHNSEIMQTTNFIFLLSLFLFVFVINYLVSEDQANRFRTEKSYFLIELIVLQLLFSIAFSFLFVLSSIFKSKTMNAMTYKFVDIEKEASAEKSDTSVIPTIKVKSMSSVSGVSKPTSLDNKLITQPKLKQLTSVTRSSSPLIKEESHPLKRHDSDNSIGSGYYYQMITATKNVRSISQYGELLKDNKN